MKIFPENFDEEMKNFFVGPIPSTQKFLIVHFCVIKNHKTLWKIDFWFLYLFRNWKALKRFSFSSSKSDYNFILILVLRSCLLHIYIIMYKCVDAYRIVVLARKGIFGNFYHMWLDVKERFLTLMHYFWEFLHILEDFSCLKCCLFTKLSQFEYLFNNKLVNILKFTIWLVSASKGSSEDKRVLIDKMCQNKQNVIKKSRKLLKFLKSLFRSPRSNP